MGKAIGKSTLKSPRRRKPQAGETQVLQPPLVTDPDAFQAPDVAQGLQPPCVVDEETTFAPLVQQVPAKIENNADVKLVSEAAAKAVEHGKKPEAGLLGYDADTWQNIHKRTAKGLKTQPKGLKKNREHRAEARNKEKQRWRKLAEPLWEGRSKKEVAQILEERTGEKFDTIYRNLKRPE